MVFRIELPLSKMQDDAALAYCNITDHNAFEQVVEAAHFQLLVIYHIPIPVNLFASTIIPVPKLHLRSNVAGLAPISPRRPIGITARSSWGTAKEQSKR